MGLLNSYALLMPVPAPLPIVSIKFGDNGGQEYEEDSRIYTEPIAPRH